MPRMLGELFKYESHKLTNPPRNKFTSCAAATTILAGTVSQKAIDPSQADGDGNEDRIPGKQAGNLPF